MRKIAIYGAGEIGKNALMYYGNENVAFFIDRSTEKQIAGFAGKRVFDTADSEVIEFTGEIIIAVADSNRDAVELALKNIGKKKYTYFEGIRKTKIVDYFTRHPISSYSKIGIYGTGKDAIFLYKLIVQDMAYEGDIIFIDRKEKIDSRDLGKKVFLLEEASQNCDAIIIGSEKYHLSIEVRIEDELKNKNIKILSPFKLDYYYSPRKLLFNKYDEGQEVLTEDEAIDSKKQSQYAVEKLKDFVNEVKNRKLLFNEIEIETYNKCNGSCEFCPVNIKDDPRKHIFMKEELFEKIVSELADINYNGRISLFSNNEPLLDDRIFEFSRRLRKALPDARIHMFTNGTLLTLDKFKELIPELDELIIDNYNQQLKLIRPVEEIMNYIMLNPELIQKVSIVLRKPKEILSTRGGEAPNRKKLEVYGGVPCSLLFRQLIIRPDGCVSLCCNDPLGKNTLGDVNKDRIIDIWYGEEYKRVRRLVSSGRENYLYCRYCDVFSCYL